MGLTISSDPEIHPVWLDQRGTFTGQAAYEGTDTYLQWYLGHFLLILHCCSRPFFVTFAQCGELLLAKLSLSTKLSGQVGAKAEWKEAPFRDSSQEVVWQTWVHPSNLALTTWVNVSPQSKAAPPLLLTSMPKREEGQEMRVIKRRPLSTWKSRPERH